jgi:hypothetical protein
MAKRNKNSISNAGGDPRADRIAELLHLDDEDVVLLAGGEATEPELVAHLLACHACTDRVAEARSILTVEPLARRSSSRRVARLMNRLAAAGAIAPEPARHARIHVAVQGNTVVIVQTDTEVRIGPRMAVRGDGGVDLPGVTFFRELGGHEVEVHLVRVPGGNFHLVVGLVGGNEGRQRVILHRGTRELAAEPARHGTATFKGLRPGEYRLEIQEEGLTIGFVTVEVEARASEEDEA